MVKLNPYMAWLKSSRNEIKKTHFSNTSLSPRDVNKELLKKAGQLWRNMSDSEKNKWRSVNVQSKSKSKSKKSKNNNSNELEEQNNKSNKKSKTKGKSKTTGKSTPKGKSKKRKASSYINWFKNNRKNIIKEHFVNETARELISKVGKKAGELWGKMSPEEKAKFAK